MLILTDYVFRAPLNTGLSSSVGGNAAAALAAAQWSHQGAKAPTEGANENMGNYSKAEIERLAEYSANLYAKTAEEKASYLEYYRNYYKNGGDTKSAQASSQVGEATSVTTKKTAKSEQKVVVDGVEYQKYCKFNNFIKSYDT